MDPGPHTRVGIDRRWDSPPTEEDGVTQVLLGGDVMLGRGIDQILSNPGDPTLVEPHVRDAGDYVAFAEARSGPVRRPVPDGWPWGEALVEIDRSRPSVLVVNLETSITRRGDFEPGKVIHYRMAPGNIGALTVVRPDVCTLANNHVRDFGQRGLGDTLAALDRVGVVTAGAGADLDAAWAPARVRTSTGVEVAVLACAHASSGVPDSWAAGGGRPGVAVLPDLSDRTAAAVATRVRREKDRGRIVVFSVHWGSNWGFHVSREQVRFAHLLVDAGTDIVHGHSSHHPRPVEVHQGRLILYGCGDLVNDYEGIGGYDEYRDDLRLLYQASVDESGGLVGVRLLPFRSRRLRLEAASPDEARWLATVLDRESRRYGVRASRGADDRLVLDWR